MRFRFLTLFLILIFVSGAWARECGLEAALRDPNIASNPQFWEDYSKLPSTEDTKAVGDLLRKYGHHDAGGGVTPAQATTAHNPNRSLSLNVDKKAEREIAHLPPNLKSKVDDFVTTISKPGGVLEVRNNPGRYHLEKLSQFGENAYSVRLNDGYRVLFDMTDAEFSIRRVNKGQIHGN